jgi:hypothetical protein
VRQRIIFACFVFQLLLEKESGYLKSNLPF